MRLRLLSALALLLAAGCTPDQGGILPVAGPPPPPVGGPATSAAFAALAVDDSPPPRGYDRDLFGPPWSDVDHNGCSQRQDVILRDTGATRTVRKGVCYADMTGHPYVDPYTETTLTSPAQIQIDHIVSLGDAWRSGAAGWAPERRKAFANDLDVLWAVQGAANEAKSDKSPDQWLPPSTKIRCEFVRRYVAAKVEYALTITSATHKTLDLFGAMCGS